MPETGGNHNAPPSPKGHTQENPQDNDKKFNYIEYYINIVQRLSRDKPENRTLAVQNTHKYRGVVQQIASLNRSQNVLGKSSLNKPPRICDSKIKSKFSSWKQEVEIYFTYYEFKFDGAEDIIS
jgi:hypothetical protein